MRPIRDSVIAADSRGRRREVAGVITLRDDDDQDHDRDHHHHPTLGLGARQDHGKACLSELVGPCVPLVVRDCGQSRRRQPSCLTRRIMFRGFLGGAVSPTKTCRTASGALTSKTEIEGCCHCNHELPRTRDAHANAQEMGATLASSSGRCCSRRAPPRRRRRRAARLGWRIDWFGWSDSGKRRCGAGRGPLHWRREHPKQQQRLHLHACGCPWGGAREHLTRMVVRMWPLALARPRARQRCRELEPRQPETDATGPQPANQSHQKPASSRSVLRPGPSGHL
jgi:hypothetical protein